MEIIEVTTVMAGYFSTFTTIMLIIVGVVVLVSIILAAVSSDSDILWMAACVLAGLGFVFIIVFAFSMDRVEQPERVRVQQEVSRISGHDVTLDEVDSMLQGDPVRDVYYVKDGHTLIVEKGSK